MRPYDRFYLPLNQQDLANTSSISARARQQDPPGVRKRRLIKWEYRTVRLLDFGELKRIAKFDPDDQ